MRFANLPPAFGLLALFAWLSAEAGDMPHIGFVFPAGAQQGSSIEIKVGGDNVYGSSAAFISGDGVQVQILDSEEPDDVKKKKKPKKDKSVIEEIIRLKVTIAKDAPLGDRELRLATPKGLSNTLNFQIGQLKEFIETEPNSVKDKSIALPPLPVAVNGQIMPGDIDFFKFKVSKGQRIVVESDVRTLIPYIADAVPGWFQADLTLYDGQGAEIAHSSDFMFNQDPVLFHVAERDGDLTLAIRDSIYRGREDFVYRLKIGELPFITSVSPLGARQGKAPVKVSLSGMNLPSSTIDLDVSSVEAPGLKFIQVSKDGLLSNAVPFAVGTLPEISVTEPCASAEAARRLELPVVVNGRLESPGSSSFFSFEGKKGQQVSMEVQARRLGSPLDSCIELFNAKGERIAKNDDFKDSAEGMLTHHADSYIMQSLPADGLYTIRLCDVQSRGGPECAYRLRVGKPVPDYELRSTPASLTVPLGGSASMNVIAIRRNGFKGEIKLSLKDGAPGISLDGAVIPAGTDKLRVTLSASETAAAGAVSPKLEGSAQIDGKAVVRKVVPSEDLMQAFIYHHFVPSADQLAMIAPPAPFSFVAKIPGGKDVLELPLGKEISFDVEAKRRPGFDEPIKLQLVDAPKGMVLIKGFIPAGRTSAKVTLRTESKTQGGLKENLILSGTMMVEREDDSPQEPGKDAKPDAKAPAAPAPGKDAKPDAKAPAAPAPEPAKDAKADAKSSTQDNNKDAKGVNDSKAPAPQKAAGEKRMKKDKYVVLAPAVPFATVNNPEKSKPDEPKSDKK